MDSNEIRTRFLKFFESRGHKIIPSASLVPENDSSVLFNTAGMQPLIPYLLGQKHPGGNRLVNVQKCVRTQDIDEVGDNTHDTFFEMMGNWSLGDYFKEEAIKWSYEFLTSRDVGLGLDPSRLYITVFEGDENAPKDTEAFNIWKKYISPERIYFMDASTNWWSVGDNGPCGADTEMFYDITSGGLGDLSKEEYIKADSEQKVVEVWNDVFMEYEKKDGKVVGKLKQKNVDTGAGLERVLLAVAGKNNIFETDLFSGAMRLIKDEATNYDEVSARIIADHIRTSIFIISDGVAPSNKDRGYILRRILRRAIFKMDKAGLGPLFIKKITETFINKYKNSYGNILQNEKKIQEIILQEEAKFRKTLKSGLKEFEQGADPFVLFTTHGFPIELTTELAKEKGQTVDLEDFRKKMAQHAKLSQTASSGMFKSGS
jgi:alanyl-tRNA synthetase